ncbi:MAG: tRNA preQ1(34) S-adenosylmethionine ribosyltransferase-isomerase QueA [Spirochaetales bacterium]|jgi:S-adenosylmethionine:tRNA ribosyltransferase-isomerase|nr:tRNA preQ1(34) S-adenosylmethionine ribosyltransferase-isomerase QueA [Spirochaetales bacterium]
MLVKDFSFDLPEELIAQVPPKERGTCRLLVMDRKTGEYVDSTMDHFIDFLDKDSIIVVNNTRVRKARVYGIAETGGNVEFLFTGDNGDGTYNAITSKSRRQKIGKKFEFLDLEGNHYADACISGELPGDVKVVSFNEPITEEFFIKCGHVPLPPYIRREDDFDDEKRYQTVYAKQCGSVAAPTAGLHFTNEIMDKIRKMGISIIEITLHVGMGTFIPMRSKTLEEHMMHFESYHISDEAALAINKAKAEGKKIIATGTTSVRTLESAWNDDLCGVKAGYGSTNLFIKPGFRFNVVDQLLTNFHTPESTLLVLVSAFADREHILKAYEHAVEKRYHFFSYGDATFLK